MADSLDDLDHSSIDESYCKKHKGLWHHECGCDLSNGKLSKRDKRIAELENMILEYQKLPYIVLKHDGKYYKCYELKQIEGVKYE